MLREAGGVLKPTVGNRVQHDYHFIMDWSVFMSNALKNLDPRNLS